MDALADRVRRFCEAHTLRGPGVVGVSGGRDSVALLHACVAGGLDVRAAHVHYGLRGEASDADEALVRHLAGKLGVAVAVHRVPPAERPARSVQAWARRVRYAFFDAQARAVGAAWVAVAHHRDDQVETVLLQTLRGAGPLGQAGMWPVRALAPGSPVRLVRPLLGAPRAEIDAYAAAHALPFHDDASNAHPGYRRARVRHGLLPLLGEALGTADLAAVLAAEAEARQHDLKSLNAEREVWQARAFGEGIVDAEALRAAPEAWRGRLLLDALERFLAGAPRSRAVAAQLARLIEAQTGRHVDFAAGRVWRTRAGLRFVPHADGQAPPAGTLAPGSALHLAGGHLTASAPAAPPADLHGPPGVCWVDADAVAWPLAVRPWQAGDRIAPFGFGGTKNVSDVLTDARWPAEQRGTALVVCAGAAVLWVPGVRRSRHAPVTPATRRAVRLAWAEAQTQHPGVTHP